MGRGPYPSKGSFRRVPFWITSTSSQEGSAKVVILMANAPRSPRAARLPPFARAVHSSFCTSVSEARHSKARRANVAAVAIQASSLSFCLPVANMAAQRKQVLTVDEREQRAQAFFDSMSDPDRLADAMARLTPQAWVTDVIANIEHPVMSRAWPCLVREPKGGHVLDELVDELGPARQGGVGGVNEIRLHIAPVALA